MLHCGEGSLYWLIDWLIVPDIQANGGPAGLGDRARYTLVGGWFVSALTLASPGEIHQACASEKVQDRFLICVTA